MHTNENNKTPWPLVARTAATTLLLAGAVWWALDGSRTAPQDRRERIFVGTVSEHQPRAGVMAGVACVTPERGEVVDGVRPGRDWCGPVYPSAGLSLASLTTGLRVRVLSFDWIATLGDGSPLAVHGGLVLPMSAPLPGVVSVHASTTTAPSSGSAPSPAPAYDSVVARAHGFAPTLIGMTEAGATAAAAKAGFTTRVVSREPGDSIIITFEFRNDRIDLTLRNGLVTETQVG